MGFARTFRVPLAASIAVIVAAGILGGPQAALLVALLAILEVSLSFDNAIVNASVLGSMSPRWQRAFLTWGILIAVFGMRLLFPILIVAAASGLGIGTVFDQALNHPHEYAAHLHAANPSIAAFGGTFLLMVFLEFFFDPKREVSWITPLENRMAALGRIPSITVGLAVIVLLGAAQLANHADRLHVLTAGIIGLVVYLAASSLSVILEPREEEAAARARSGGAGTAAKAGLAAFIYLEVLDSSFSFDGVIGAFAISTDIFIIAAGLGLGAFFIRTLTVWLVHQGTLQRYAYLAHGAHWAIGTLAILLFISIEHRIPEVVTGLAGAAIITASLATSVYENRRATHTTPVG